VTVADRLTFAQSFNRLAVATRLPSSEADASMQQVYWDGLEDLPIGSVELAAEALAKAGQWFPKVAEWREAATRQRLAEVLTLPPGRDEPWQFECSACEDTGWETKSCYPGTAVNCGRKRCVDGGEFAREHGFTYRCSCRETNRTFQRHHCVPRGQERY
jgi:hypothetical protein